MDENVFKRLYIDGNIYLFVFKLSQKCFVKFYIMRCVDDEEAELEKG